MIQTIAKTNMPVDEVLRIRKNRIQPDTPTCSKRISIVTGIHGDELEGQFVCYEVARRIEEHPEFLKGTVDIYQALNALGIESVTRGLPGFYLVLIGIFRGSC
ncbi:MAG: succinylglutamate desuccinylase/aspartoacylase family protein, partial [Lachnospiraceae bacterium]|nr:succinylglutamate desuccinylase/aspartoacylase family protein [Lachnospiraceae bacterium]